MLRASPGDAPHPLHAALEVRAIIHDGMHRLVPTMREDNLPWRADSWMGTVAEPQKGSFPPAPLLWWQQHGVALHRAPISGCVPCQLPPVPVVLSCCRSAAPLVKGP